MNWLVAAPLALIAVSSAINGSLLILTAFFNPQCRGNAMQQNMALGSTHLVLVAAMAWLILKLVEA